MTAKETVQALYAAYATGDPDRIAALLHPDVIWVAPAGNATQVALGFVGTIRRECLDWLLIANRRHLQHVLHEFVDHYNAHRPHRALGLVPPEPQHPPPTAASPQPIAIRSVDTTGSAASSTSTSPPENLADQVNAPHRLALCAKGGVSRIDHETNVPDELRGRIGVSGWLQLTPASVSVSGTCGDESCGSALVALPLFGGLSEA
jgi:hypothetical protein